MDHLLQLIAMRQKSYIKDTTDFLNFVEEQRTKMTVAFANIFMAEIETNLLNQSGIKPIEWRRYIDDVSPLGHEKRGPR